jgi:hypothetical protein
MTNVLMQVPAGQAGAVYTTQNATYTANTAGLISVLPTDVNQLALAGCTFADLTGTVAPSTAAAGTTQGTAAALPTLAGQEYPVTGANGTAGVVLGAADAVTGRQIFINNLASAVLLIYPPGTGTINGLGASAAFSTVSGHGARLVCLNGANNQWAALG